MRGVLILLALAAMVTPLAAEGEPCGGLWLRDVAAESGLDFEHANGATGAKHLPETMGAGLAWFDYDLDGRIDLYVVQSGPFPPDGADAARNRLFRNLGGGSFADVTDAAGAGDPGYGQGVVAADVDGDGFVDLYVSNFGPDVLLRNRGDGTFVDDTSRAGLGLSGWSASAAFADADRDGDLDLYVTRYVEYDPALDIFCGDPESGRRRYCDPTLFRGATDRYYRNVGGGRFEDATDDAGFGEADGKGLGVVFTDLDDDGFPDVYVANDLTINLLYRNRGDGAFEALSLISGAGLNRDGKAEAGMGLAVGDVDGDGDPDLMVSNFDVETNTLYENLGRLEFRDVAAESNFGPPSFNLLGFGLILGDLDLDGDLDAYTANGHIFERPNRDTSTYAQPDLLLLGDGSGRFRPAVCGPAFDSRHVGRGLAAADYDEDGDLDIAVGNNGGPLQLLRNDRLQREWLGVRLSGRPPNTEAVGARVSVESGRRKQVRWVEAGQSYVSSNDRRLLFGFADGESPRKVTIEWPDGSSAAIEAPEPRRYLHVRQGSESRSAGTAGSAPGGLVPVGLALLVSAAAVASWIFFRRRSRRG